MEALDFAGIAKLLNHSRNMSINPKPQLTVAGQWELWDGQYKVHTQQIPFQILYLYSRATSDGIRQASRAFVPGLTQIVYAPSLDDRTKAHHEAFKNKTQSFWTTTDYLHSVLREELDAYIGKLDKNVPSFYVDPPIQVPQGSTRKVPNPILSLLTDPDTASSQASGMLGIVLADPGVGKTYQCQYLVSTLARSKKNVFPIYISAEQWRSMGQDDLGSIWKTLVHSFRYFETPIGWLEGCEEEFLRTTLKAGLFRIIFDGFDEYILRNQDRTTATNTLKVLLELARDTAARIVVTSRESFWNHEVDSQLTGEERAAKELSVYKIMHFDLNHGRQYFKKRFEKGTAKSSDELTERAMKVFTTLRAVDDELVSRGFALNLIADLVDRGGIQEVTESSPIHWLMHSLCLREEERQGLPIDASHQLLALKYFLKEQLLQEPASDETLSYVLKEADSSLSESDIRKCLDRLSSHPLIQNEKTAGKSNWVIPQDQVRVALLGEYMIDLVESDSEEELKMLAIRGHIDEAYGFDIASMIVNLCRDRSNGTLNVNAVRSLVATLLKTSVKVPLPPDQARSCSIAQLATMIAVSAVEHEMPRGRAHKERAEFLMALFPNGKLDRLYFTGTMSGMDFRGVQFSECVFDHVRWANCDIDQDTRFVRPFLKGGSETATKYLGLADWESPTGDMEGLAFVKAIQTKAGAKQYSASDLANDVGCVLLKFIAQGGVKIKTIKEHDLITGPINVSPHRDTIINEMMKYVLENHHISGISDKGIHVRDGAINDLKFFAVNNVFTGPIKETFDHLKKKLQL